MCRSIAIPVMWLNLSVGFAKYCARCRGGESSRINWTTFRIWKLETVPIRLRPGLLESQSQYPEREGLEPVRREPDSHRTLRRLRRSPRSTPPAKVTNLQQCPGTHP